MIPRQLRISGFLSYREEVEINFDNVDLACISGHNGAGKSSMLDALTWALFGEARGRGTDVINLHQDVKSAEVSLIFDYEGNTFKVQRILPRTKSAVLEFQALDGKIWKPLTEKTTRDTQARIIQTLRLDYETFINASFFLQGKADQFTQKKPGERKTVLGSILGLEVWEEYKARAAEKRKLIEEEVVDLEARISEIEFELSQEGERRSHLEELERSLLSSSKARAGQEAALEALRKNAVLIGEQKKQADALAASLQREQNAMNALSQRLSAKESEQRTFLDLIQRSAEIERSLSEWKQRSAFLEQLEETASKFRELEMKRSPLLALIAAESARYLEEQRGLQKEQQEILQHEAALKELQPRLLEAQEKLGLAELNVKELRSVEEQRSRLREQQAALKAENDALYSSMQEIKTRLESLKAANGASCPLCGQELSEEHREETTSQLAAEGKKQGDKHRANQSELSRMAQDVKDLSARASELSASENELLRYSSLTTQLTSRIETIQAAIQTWEAAGKRRLEEVIGLLETSSFALDARQHLASLDVKLSELAYDASVHEEIRRSVAAGREVESQHNRLQSARDVNKQIEGEIASLKAEIALKQDLVGKLAADHQEFIQNLRDAEGAASDLNLLEKEVFDLREEENRIRGQVGAARQKVEVLASQKNRKKDFLVLRDEANLKIARYKTLERSFGRDGVPALLIEQALPQIEQKANDLLDRLSDGAMSLRFVTQAEYKNKKRDDLKETLDIQISDSSGVRDYEMYSGGEAFRVNFAVRLALSEILAQRKGARLQTLVIDEGFGSQDALGRQRLVEAINLVRHDFAKILVITHLDELKDAFPSRIEVDKTDSGSTVRIT